jgi:hypothetical protein
MYRTISELHFLFGILDYVRGIIVDEFLSEIMWNTVDPTLQALVAC